MTSLFRKLFNFTKSEKELNKDYVIVFGSSSWAEIYEIDNTVCKSDGVEVYTFSEGIKYFGVDNYDKQPGICVGLYANIDSIKKDKKSIVHYMKSVGCNQIPIDAFLQTLSTYK